MYLACPVMSILSWLLCKISKYYMTMMTTRQSIAKVSMYYEVHILNMTNLSAVSGTASLSQHTTAMVDAREGWEN
jgi:hypothetical protein